MRRDRGGAKSRGNRSAPYGNRDNGGMMRNMGNFDRNTDMNHRTSGNGGPMNMMGNRGPPMDRKLFFFSFVLYYSFFYFIYLLTVK